MNSPGIKLDFSTSERIIFSTGALEQLSQYLPPEGKILIVTGKSTSRRFKKVESLLTDSGREIFTFHVKKEPTPAEITRALAKAKNHNCSIIVSVGGGSVIDTGKAVAALLTNPGELFDYLEIIGKGLKLRRASAFFAAIPTTAGTGSEVTRNAVILDPYQRIKVSMRSRMMLPHLALVDPALSLSLPPRVTADSGLDALTQLIEGFLSKKANPFTDALAIEAIPRVAQALPLVYADGENLAGREEMALGALFSGLILANAGLGAVHGIAGPLGGFMNIPHGAACARLLPETLEANLQAINQRGTAEQLGKFIKLSELLTGKIPAQAQAGCYFIRSLVKKLKVRGLSEFGLKKGGGSDQLLEQIQNSSSMKGNPIELNPHEIQSIINSSLLSP